MIERDLDALTSIPSSDFVPLAVEERYEAPRRGVHPDEGRGWIRRLTPVVGNHRLAFTIAIVGTFIGLVTQVAVPRIVMAAIDDTVGVGSRSIDVYVAALVALALAHGISSFVGRTLLFRTAYGIEYDLRVSIYERLSSQTFSFYDRVQSGQLISRANSDIRSVQRFLIFAPMILMNMVTFVLAFVLMVTVSVPLTIVALAPMPIVVVLGVRMRELMFPISWIIQERQAEVATVVDESVAGVRVVKAFAGEQQEVTRLARAAQRMRWAMLQQIGARARYAPPIEAMPRVGMGLVLVVGGYLAIHGRATVGTIVAFSAYVVMLQAPFRMVGGLMMMSQRAAASAIRIFEVLDAPIELSDRPGAVDLVDPRGEIELRDVSFGYREGQPVLDHANLHIEAGERVALVGRTGCGKSTVVRLVARYYDVGRGSVLLDGTDVRDLTLRSVRGQVGMVFDDPFLFSASVHDNIAFARPDATLDDVIVAARAANAHEFIDALPNGYETLIGERGYDLSGGQRQRLSIARTLLANPPILVLDDATSAIDVQVEQQIHEALERLIEHRTTILIAHRLSTIALADRVVLLDDGRVIATGTHAELLASEPRYAQVLSHLPDADRAVAPAPEDAR